jgi:hypothetical protein
MAGRAAAPARSVSSFRSGGGGVGHDGRGGAADDVPDYYRVLGVPRDATADQIKAAFRELGEWAQASLQPHEHERLVGVCHGKQPTTRAAMRPRALYSLMHPALPPLHRRPWPTRS